ncbi:ribonuclease H [Senna tora]|uniref:Ribonuclease H n=1 Tax=Senna tora TaxID=362788 RepID=A0A834WR53_9FABA|nr:ribonuclease H [Senna tora]
MAKLRMEEPVVVDSGEAENGVDVNGTTLHPTVLEGGGQSDDKGEEMGVMDQQVIVLSTKTKINEDNYKGKMEVAGQQKMVLQEIQNVVGPGGGEYGEKENVDPLSNRKSLRRYKKEARTCTGEIKVISEMRGISKRKRMEGLGEDDITGEGVGMKKPRGEEKERRDERTTALIDVAWADSRSTRVWGEAWIPGTFPYSIEKPNNIIAGELRVCDLLDDMGLWREEVLEFLFPTDICHRIKCIRTPEEGREDRWNWLGDAKGGFTVRQCYLHAMKDGWQAIDLLPNIPGGIPSDFWRKLWKLPVLPKHKSFIWRACVGILPTCVALKNKGVEMAEGCTFCGMEEEGTYHVLVECPMLNVVWSGSRFDYGSRIWHNSISEWLAVEGNTWSQDQMGICVIALFLVWEARNAARFTDVNFRTDNFWCKVEGVWEEVQDSKSWKEWNDVFGRHLRWEKPKEGMVKLNTDAGTLADGGGVIGGIVRDSDGICVAAFTERVAMVCNPTVLEAEAIRRGMEVALRLGRVFQIKAMGDSSLSPSRSVIVAVAVEIRHHRR